MRRKALLENLTPAMNTPFGKRDQPRPQITSASNPAVKLATRLRDSGARRKQDRFLVDGWREISLARAHGIELEIVFFVEPGENPPLSAMRELEHGGDRQPPILQPVSAAIMEKLSYGQRADSPVAIAATPLKSLAELTISATSQILVLDRTEKPGNLGACLRTAAACGIDAVVLTDTICELYNPNTIRSSRGSIFSLPIALCSALEFQTLAGQLQLPILPARVDGSRTVWSCDLSSGYAVVFGNEADGLGENWPRGSAFTIPMSGTSNSPPHTDVHGRSSKPSAPAADSLNLSISAAITLYEAFRQRVASASPKI